MLKVLKESFSHSPGISLVDLSAAQEADRSRQKDSEAKDSITNVFPAS